MRMVQRVLAACGGIVLIAACGPQGNGPPRASLVCGSQADPYVCARGQDLVYRGPMLRLDGATLYPRVTLGGRTLRGAAWASASVEFTAYLDHWLDVAHESGLNTIRPTDFLAGVSDWHDRTTWRNLDHLVSGAAARHMFVVVDLSAYRDFLRRSGRFAYDSTTWASFLDFVGSRFANSPAVAYYAIAGEVEPPVGSTPGRATADQYVAFFRDAIARLHAADHGHHLVSTGGLDHLDDASGVPWQALFALPGQDVAALHVYSDGDRQRAVPAVAAWAAAQGQPFVIEEFGFRQELGDAARGAAFRSTYALGRGAGAAGMLFWNLGPELTPYSYDVSPATPAVWAAVADASRARGARSTEQRSVRPGHEGTTGP